MYADFKNLANALRFLAIDMVEAAGSGHPGLPLGMADVACILFSKHLRFSPHDPKWEGRDRLIFSAGHGSALLYSCLYLCGYHAMDLSQIKRFRQLGSLTAGHPEFNIEHGIEATTGPLGQGLGMAVGMALSAKIASSRQKDVDAQKLLEKRKIFVLCGDGCLAEGIGQEAISIAGHYALDNLILLFDDNNITIDGATTLSTSEDHMLRAQAAGWATRQVDGHNYAEIDDAITWAKQTSRPSLIACKTIIGFGIPGLSGSHKTHGSPIGNDAAQKTREHLNWPHPSFETPPDIIQSWRNFWLRNEVDYLDWTQRDWQLSKSDDSIEWDKVAMEFGSIAAEATRASSGKVLHSLLLQHTNLIGGSADLSASNNTRSALHQDVKPHDYAGNYIHYGIREHVMAAICNGIALYNFGSMMRPYCGTFLVFADYMRPAIRMSALMGLPVIYVLTHDSIGVGEDGPTHQPVEHLASLRIMPNVRVIRPCNGREVLCTWRMALENTNGPTAIVLSRQKVHPIPGAENIEYETVARGGYIAYRKNSVMQPEIVICATGSEVALAYEVALALEEKGIEVTVVSMPCAELFLSQDEGYRDAVIPKTALRVVIEAGVKFGWERILGDNGLFYGVESYGISAPAEEIFRYFGLNKHNIATDIANKHGMTLTI